MSVSASADALHDKFIGVLAVGSQAAEKGRRWGLALGILAAMEDPRTLRQSYAFALRMPLGIQVKADSATREDP